MVFGRLHVLPVAMEFLKAYPAVDIRCVLNDRVVNLLEDHIDLALRIGDLPDSSSLITTRIGSVRRVVCGSPAYFARRGVPENIDELAMHDCITFEGFPFPDFWMFPTSKANVSAAVRARLVVNTAVECWCSRNHNMHPVSQATWHVATADELAEAFAAATTLMKG